MRDYTYLDVFGVDAAREALAEQIYELTAMGLDPWDEDMQAEFLRERAGIAGSFGNWSYTGDDDVPF